MKRRVIAYKHYYKDFFESLDEDIQEKILYGMLLLKTQDRSNIYRIFFCFDVGQVVVLFNCFQKKSQKTPTKEINKALKLKAEYEERKKHGDI